MIQKDGNIDEKEKEKIYENTFEKKLGSNGDKKRSANRVVNRYYSKISRDEYELFGRSLSSYVSYDNMSLMTDYSIVPIAFNVFFDTLNRLL